MRRTVYKKNKGKKQDQFSFFKVLVWVFCATFFLWLTWILWFSAGSSGPAGQSIYNCLKNILGTACYFLPFFLIYWLYRAVKYKTLAFITLLFGVFLALSGLAILIAFMHNNFQNSSLAGGVIGDFFFKHLKGVSGTSGAIIIAMACSFLGIHILFAIPWKDTILKTCSLIKEDFTVWMQARADLKQKIAERKEEEKQNISLETFIFSRSAFDKIIALSHKVSSLYGFRRMVSYAINHHRIAVHAFEYDGYVVPILSSMDYVNKSFELLSYENRQKLFLEDWPIYTTTHNTPPALYGEHAKVKNSFIANGAIIKGQVENSIISRDVVIEEGVVIKNCLLFTQTYVGKDTHLEYVLTDKNVKVNEVKELSGTKDRILVIKQGDII